MNRFSKFSIFLILFLVSVPSYANRNKIHEAPAAITIMASSSLTNVLTELIRNYSTQKAISITAIYDSPTELEHNIQSGDIADIYIAEHPVILRDLKRSGALNVFSITEISGNQLVIVASNKSRLSKISDETLSTSQLLHNIIQKTLLYIGDPQTTWVGMTTKHILEELEQWQKISPFVVRVGNVRNNLYLIDKGETVGIVYHTDALTNKNVKVLSLIDLDLHEPITYNAAIVAGNNMQLAQGFLNYLQSNEAKKIFKQYGFLGLDK